MDNLPLPASQLWPGLIAVALLLLAAIVVMHRGDWPVLLVAVALQAPPDPRLLATLDSPTSSTVRWSSDRQLCLSYNGAPDRCYAAGSVVVTFGHVGPLSGDLRPAAGGVYTLTDPASGATWRAQLRQPILLAAIRR